MTEEQEKIIFDASASAQFLVLVWTSEIDIISGLSKMQEIELVNHQGNEMLRIASLIENWNKSFGEKSW